MADDPTKLSYDDMVSRWVARGYPEPAAKGIADNMMRESGGKTTEWGDNHTSYGLFQHHNERRTALESFAKAQDKPVSDPDVQIAFADQEMKRDYPKLRETLLKTDSRAEAEDSFKRIFERPASVMWQKSAGGQPVLGNERYQFSDGAMAEHQGKPNTDLVYMPPADYLDLAPPLAGKAMNSSAGRSLRRSLDKGEPVESIPSLDIDVDGPTATVTDQDGRHRALAAQEAGLTHIPVAINRSGQGQPSEIVGMQGKALPHRYPGAADVSRETQPDGSIWGSIKSAFIPSAQAAEVNDWQDVTQGAAAQAPADGDWQDVPQQPASAGERFATGLADPIVAVGQIAGNVAPEKPTIAAGLAEINQTRFLAGLPPMEAEPGPANIAGQVNAETAAREKAIQAREPGGFDWARLGGNLAATLPLSLGGGMAAGGNALARLGGAALGGAAGAAAQPVTEGDFAAEKAKQMGEGAVAGGVLGAAGNALAGVVAPTFRKAMDTLIREGVELTPGQMAGGMAKSIEDRMTSAPITGDAIQAARRRSFETFNRAAWNRVLAPLGETMPDTVKMGRDAAAYVGDRASAAYQRILPNLKLGDLRLDQTMVDETKDLLTRARATLPDAQVEQLKKILHAQVVEKLGPTYSTNDGELLNGIDSMLGREAAGYKADPMHDNKKMGEFLGEAQAMFRSALERHNPEYAPQLKAAREAWANFVRVGRAAASTGTGTSEGIFSPAQLNSAVRASDPTIRKMGYSKGTALLQDLSDAGMAVLPNKYPDSGTAGRAGINALAALAVGGGGYELHHPEVALSLLGAGLAGAVPYTPPVSRVTNAIVNRLAQTPGPTRNALAEIMRRTGSIAPAAGVAAAAP